MMRIVSRLLPALMLLTGVAWSASEPNYDESKIPAYELPELLRDTSGQQVATADQWRDTRRPELLELCQQHIYGAMPPARPLDRAVVAESTDHAVDDIALRRQVTLYLSDDPAIPPIHVLIYLPKQAMSSPVPVFMGLNFDGNHTVTDDPHIRLTKVWDSDGPPVTPDDASRGSASSRWPVRAIVRRGYGVVTAYYGDIDPDFDDGFKNGIHPLYPEFQHRDDNWSSIGAWAWGLCRMLDYLETFDEIDADRVAVVGHSRLGKTAVWAGAYDQRFAMVISNNSGCGGAALSRRRIGESVEAINRRFPHWFCRNHRHYNDNENAMPIDQHAVLALVAPRPLYVASATEDRWADPHGEFLSAVAVTPVYELLGASGLPTDQWPAAESPLHGIVSYHLRSGRHEITAYDWQQYLDFADAYLSAE